MKNLKKIIAAFVVLTMLLPILAGCGEPAHTHVYGEWQTIHQATCTEKGTMTRSCACGESVTEQIPMVEHVYEDAITRRNSCTVAGERTYTCTNCGDSYKEALEHKEYAATELYNLVRDSVGAVEIYNKKGEILGVGSCFVYAENTLVTNYHVIEGASWLEVSFGKDTYKVDKVLAYDKDIDVAVLKVDGAELQPLTVCKLEHAVGTPVYALGNSQGLDSTFSDGMITTASREVGGVMHVQHDAPISGGNSGGPLFNGYGEVVGINTFTVRDSQNLNFAIAMTEMDNLTYGQTMTMDAVTGMEYNAFTLIAGLAEEVGIYDEGNYYAFLINDTVTMESGDVERSFNIIYEPTEKMIWFFYELDGYSFALYIDSALSGEYFWVYSDEFGNEIMGDVVAGTYVISAPLSGSTPGGNTNVPETLRTMCGLLLTCMCLDVQEAFSDIGVTAEDLGFTAF